MDKSSYGLIEDHQ